MKNFPAESLLSASISLNYPYRRNIDGELIPNCVTSVHMEPLTPYSEKSASEICWLQCQWSLL